MKLKLQTAVLLSHGIFVFTLIANVLCKTKLTTTSDYAEKLQAKSILSLTNPNYDNDDILYDAVEVGKEISENGGGEIENVQHKGDETNNSDGTKSIEPIKSSSYKIPSHPSQLGTKFAQPITVPLQQQYVRLDQIYKPDAQLDIVLYLKFAKSFPEWDPRGGNYSHWKWGYSDTSYPTDQAYIRHDTHDKNSYGKSEQQKYGGVTLVSVPFNRYLSQDDANVKSIYYQALVQWKQNVSVSTNGTQRIVFRMKFACKIIDAEKHPFPRALVSNAWDDPRLGSCTFTVIDKTNPDGGPYFYFSVTNKAVWAVYGTGKPSNTVSKRRVGTRQSYNDVVDAAIEYDGFQNIVSYYLNGVKVWTIYALGAPVSPDRTTKTNYGQGAIVLARPNIFTLDFGPQQCLDESDPNNPQSATRLVALLGKNSTFYASDAQFYDSESLRSNVIWGQGAKMTIYKLLIARTQAILPQFVAPPSTDGHELHGGGGSYAYL